MFEPSTAVDATREWPELAAAIAAVPVRPEGGGSAVAAGAKLRALVELTRQLQARVVGAVAAFDEQGFAVVDGAASTAAWLRATVHMDASHATRVVRSGRVLSLMPALGAQLAAGVIGPEHVEAIAMTTTRMPLEKLAKSDEILTDFAVQGLPSGVRRLAKRLQELHDESTVDDEAQELYAGRYLVLSQTFQDVWYIEGKLDPEMGAMLQAALLPLSQPTGPEDTRTSGQRRADALLELTAIGLRSGELPDCGGDRPRLTLVVRDRPRVKGPDAALTDIAGAATGQGPGSLFSGSRVNVTALGDNAELLGSGALMPSSMIERFACDADLDVIVVDEFGDPLRLGRKSRSHSTVQRKVLVVRDGGCVFPGCDRPPAFCQVHHLKFWGRHLGRTDIENLALVCSFHHHLVHDAGWVLERIDHGGPPELEMGLSPPGPHGRSATQRARDHDRGTLLGWLATAPDGRQFREHRRPAA